MLMKLLDYLPVSTHINYGKFQIYIFSRFEDISNIQLLLSYKQKRTFWHDLFKALSYETKTSHHSIEQNTGMLSTLQDSSFNSLLLYSN